MDENIERCREGTPFRARALSVDSERRVLKNSYLMRVLFVVPLFVLVPALSVEGAEVPLDESNSRAFSLPDDDLPSGFEMLAPNSISKGFLIF